MWIVLFVIRQESNIDSVCYGVALSLRDDSGMKRNQDLQCVQNGYFPNNAIVSILNK
uniref:Uncharacterized protein n=2 Tax=Vibrionaceae TaxID=641 RepID=A0A0H3ZYD6_ALIFS|nr:hypothetical protein [Vibrio tasmaniensis]AKN38476.1 hypothetical protein [Aliivibrio fischeri]AKN38512.1 hypothetical protein [Aliivibrio fischeri]